MKENSDGYINDQSAFSSEKGSFGRRGSISENGCGSIAAYNALKMLGIPEKYEAVLAAFYRHTIWRGRLGADPFYLARFLRKRGVRVKLYLRVKKVPLTHKAYIFLYDYLTGRKLGAHYAAAEYDGNAFVIYNDDSLTKREKRVVGVAELKKEDKAKHLAVFALDLKK